MISVLMLTSKGMAGVPGSSFLALSATATALGNCLATFVVAKSENALDRDRMQRAFDGHPDSLEDIIEAEAASAEAAEAARAEAGPEVARATR